MKIVSKKQVGIQRVFDITVSNTHTFVANGIVTHNCHTYKIANHLKRTLKSRRVLVHNSENREQVLEQHMNGTKATVLLSPSMTEGIDLKDDRARFQIICKVPYPYLGDKVTRKRMNKHKWYYPYATAKTIVQSIGRSVRNMDDHAVTYILDSDWARFYGRNRDMFPPEFHSLIQKR